MITTSVEAVQPPVKDKGLIISAFKKWFKDTRSDSLSTSVLKNRKSTQDKKAAKDRCG